MNDLNPDLLAALLDSEDVDADVALDIPVAVSAPGQARALSFSQRQLWLLQQIDPEQTAYNLPRVFRLKGRLDVPALQRAFQALIDRHAVLRTVYESLPDGQPVQRALADIAFTLGHDDLRGLPAPEREAQSQVRVEQVVRHVFDLTQAPALVARVITVSDNEHLLAVCLHHIASDAWSNPIIARDLAKAYGLALRSSGRVALPAPRIQYAGYAQWQRDRADQGGFARELSHWNAHLGPEVPALALPTDKLRPGRQDFNGAARHFSVNPSLASALQALCRAQQCTPFMLLMAAWQALLARHCGQADFAIGVPHAGRHREETQELVGFFVSTQAFRARLRPGMSLRQLCQQVRKDTLAALDHADLPLEVLLDSRNDQRDPARSPLFQVLFGFQMDDGQSTLSLDGLRAEALDTLATGAKFELSLDMTLGPDGLQGRLEYATALFKPATIDRLIHGYQRVLEALAYDPDGLIAGIDLLHAGDQALLQQWRHNTQCHDESRPVHHLIEDQVRHQPASCALVSGENSLSYAELNARANQWAHHLRRLGVGPDVAVGIATERSLEMVVGLLAIVKAGGAYVPMDPELPAERLAYMLDDSGVDLLLTQAHLRSRLPKRPGGRVLALDEVDVSAEPTTNPEVPLHPESLAYVIYTSGSTGRPKGVANRHSALTNRLAWMQQAYGLSPQDVVLQKTPFSFDVSVWEFFWPLMVGARLVMAEPGDHRDPARLVSLIVSHGVSTLHFVPSMLQAFMAHEGVKACVSLRRIVCSGEALPADLQVRVLRELPWAGLYNLYGPTEAAIDVTHWTCQDDGAASVPIGAPISATRTLVLDADLNEVAPGVPGELYLGGEGLARGYLHRAALTSERFVADPFDSQGGRLYRTGDLVRWRDDGQIEYLGRIDHQVKVRGFRIELGEVEAQLLSHGAVREAVVVAHDGGVGGTRLVAYVTPQPGQPPESIDTGAVREHLLRALPDYMVPTVLMVLQALPLNANGKVDRKALPEPVLADRGQAAQDAAQGDAEQALSTAWCQVLGLQQVGRHENFFELGGDSILSLQIVARVRAAGWKISPRQLFERQTLAELAAVAQRIEAGTPAMAADQASEGLVPLLPVQADFLAQDRPSPHHWNQAVLLECRHRVKPAQLTQALHALLIHHDALRLRYQRVDGVWQQTLTVPDDSAPVLWVRQARDADELAAVCREAQRSLDLSAGPLLRGVWIDLAEGGARLLLVAHHLVIDTVSWRILLEDLQTACDQLRQGLPIVLRPKTTSFNRWSTRLRDEAPSREAEFSQWRDMPDTPSTLPCDHPEGSTALGDQAHADLQLDSDQTTALLKRAPMAYRTQANDLLLTALGRALCRWSGTERVRIDLEGHGREDLFDDIDLSRTVGWFTAVYPVVIEPLGAPGQAIQRVKEQLRRVPRGGLGHGLFLHHGTPEQRQALQSAPRAQVLFNYLGQFDGSFDDQAWWVPAVESAGACMDEAGPASHELSIGGQVYEGALRLHVRYGAQRHRAESMEALLQAFREELLALIDHCVGGVQARGGALGLTPSDVPLSGLDQAALDHLSVPVHRIEDLYPLSPMQAGMLFHSMLDPQGSAYLNQVRLDLDGLDEGRLQDAWLSAMQRHEVLRAGFLHDRDVPLQWVTRGATVPLSTLDWRDRDATAEHLHEALDALAREELAKGFDLARPPLMRLVLVRLPADGTPKGAARHHLLWTYHHLLLDGWSTSQLLAEVLRHHGGEHDIVRPVSGWREHIAWLASRDVQASRRFWEAACEGLSTPTRLAPQLPLGAAGTGGMGLHETELDPARTAHLADFARRERVTLNTLVQAAWALLLKSRTGLGRVCFGATTSGRPSELPGIEHALGLFINTLPVVVDCAPELPVGEWLRGVQALNLAAREHEHTPLNDIQRWTGHGGQGLFDNIVVFENYPVDEALAQDKLGRLHCTGVRSREETSYPMTVAVLQGDTLRLRYGYARTSFDAATVGAIAAQVEHLLMLLAGRPARRLGELRLLDAPALARLAAWRHSDHADACSQAPVHQLIAAQARRQPEATALILGDERLAYQTLNRRANQLAHHLRREGVGPDTLVGVAMARSFDLVISLLAVLKTGAAYVPLDPAYPADRLAYMGRDSGMALLLTQQHLQATMALPGVPCIAVDTMSTQGMPDHEPDVPVHGAQLAYVIYTSGSTGQPKGVAVSHGPLSMHCQVTAELYEMGPWTREFHFLSFAFDGAHERWLTALLCGASLLLRDDELWSAEHTSAELARQGVTNAGFPPVYLQQLAASAEASGTAPPVSLYSFGGEAMPRASLELVQRALHPRILINGYGPTEAVVTPLLWKGGAHDTIEGGYVPIGRPVGRRTAHVLDADLNEVAPGVPGELYLGGEGLARGYLHRAALTSERFVADPFDSQGGRLYRTGDLVRWRDDGQIEYLGRIDHQIKVRGFRIELGEVEAQLLSHGAVREAVVVAHEGGAGGTRLVAYVTPQPGQPPESIDTGAVREHLLRALPDYMVPSVLVVLQALPLNANGKVDRKALPEPVLADRGQAVQDAAQGDAEQALSTAWCQVLGLQQVGRHENFFELGGDSILSLQIVARVRAAGWKISPRQLFERQTLAELAAVAQRIEVDKPSRAVEVQEGVARPLLPIQRLFFDKPLPQRNHWNQSVLLGCDQALQPDALRQALRAVVRHHAALRTAFHADEQGRWAQTIGPVDESADLLWVRQAETPADITPLCDQAQRSLDLSRGEVLRALLISLPDGSARLLLTAHHLVVDGVSWRVLLEDLRATYQRELGTTSSQTAVATASYGQWVNELAAHTRSGGFDADTAHWAALSETQAHWPATHAQGSCASAFAARASFELGAGVTQRLLKEAPAAYRTQVNDLLLAALSRVLCRHRRTQAFLIDLEGHGREDLFDGIDLSRTVGWFTSVFPLRLEAADNLGDTIGQVKEALAAVPQRGLSFGALGQWGQAGSRETLARLPRRDVAFNYLGQFDSRLDEPADSSTSLKGPRHQLARWWPASESAGASSDPGSPLSHELVFNGQVIDGVFSMALDYSAQRHDADAMAALMAELQQELLTLIDHCTSGASGVSPSDFPQAALSWPALQSLVAQTGRQPREIEDIYPLTPVQQGMLVDALLAPGSVVNVVQTHALFDHFDMARLHQAWETVVARHAVLRTGFFWRGADAPVQVVFRSAPLSIEHLDWQGRSTAEAEWQALCDRELHRGFDPEQAPLMRVVVARIDDQQDRLVWTWHHLLMDGWSMSRLLGEVFTLYGGGQVGAVGPSFGEHVAWAGQTTGDDEAFWRGILRQSGGQATLLFGAQPRPVDAVAHGVQSVLLDAVFTQRLQASATAQHVTLNTLVQAAWALVLAAHTGQCAVTFGATMSGRSSDMPRVGEVMGLCINTLPIVCMPDPARPVGEWLRALLDHNLSLRQREHVALADIQRWAGHAGQPLFDTLLIFENFPVDQALLHGAGASLQVRDLVNRGATSSPLTLVVIPGPELRVSFEHAQGLVDESLAADLLRQFQGALQALVHDARRPLSQVVVPVPQVDLRRAAPGAQRVAPAVAQHPPGPSIRDQLRVWWCRILALDAVDDQAHFFELGGDSLAAARLVSAWNKPQGHEPARPHLALATVFAHPVLADMAAAIEAGGGPDAPSPVARAWQAASVPTASKMSAAEGAPAPRLYLCPARAWHANEYDTLLQTLQGRHEAWRFGCEPDVAGEIAWAGSTVSELAARQAEIIRAQRPEAPCCLLGWSVGGLVALETARLLQGHVPVAWVGLVDPSGFPALRGLLAHGQPLLEAHHRAQQESLLASWLSERSGMRAHWLALLSAMGPIERDAFLGQVIAAHGADGEHLPADGPAHGSTEQSLWSEMNCLRLGATHALPEQAGVPVRIWRSEADIEGLADVAARCATQPVLLPGTDHLSVLDAPAFHAEVLSALEDAARGARRAG